MRMFSTSFFPLYYPADVDNFIACLQDIGADGVELEYRIPANLFAPLKSALRRNDFVVGSLHNFCPMPPEFKRGSGDLFSLAAIDREERHAAVRLTLQTIEQANDLEARAVVLHCGRVAMVPETDVLHGFYRSGRIATDEACGFIARQIAVRDRLKPSHLDALCFSLEKLLPAAERHHVRLGLENRYHYHELPGIDDFELLFREFDGAPLGYWHDTGHAHAAEMLTLFSAQDLLNRYGANLVGCHLHDARGLEDHLPPGQGQIDFTALRDFLNPSVVAVIELKRKTAAEDAHKGAQFLTAVLGPRPSEDGATSKPTAVR